MPRLRPRWEVLHVQEAVDITNDVHGFLNMNGTSYKLYMRERDRNGKRYIEKLIFGSRIKFCVDDRKVSSIWSFDAERREMRR